MVTDGIAILKVGPALTYGLREALFSLSMMEKELVPEEKRANFIETLDAVMLASPANWEKHYHGDEKHLAQCRKYSYSDRCLLYTSEFFMASASGSFCQVRGPRWSPARIIMFSGRSMSLAIFRTIW